MDVVGGRCGCINWYGVFVLLWLVFVFCVVFVVVCVVWFGCVDDFVFVCLYDCFVVVVYVEFCVDCCDVIVYGVWCEFEVVGDFFVG